MGDGKKAGSVALIIKRMKGSHGSDEMREGNERMMESMSNEFGDELDVSSAIDSAAEGIMLAVERKDKDALKRALKSFLEIHKMEMEHEEDDCE